MDSKITKIVLLICGLEAAYAGEESCDYKGNLGNSFKIPLGFSPMPKDHIIWRKNGTTLSERKREKPKCDANYCLSEDGSLELGKVTLTHEGIYGAEVFNSDGRSAHKLSKQLCVIGSVPILDVACSEKGATLTCNVENNKDVTFSWYFKSMDVKKSSQTLWISSDELTQITQYACSQKFKNSQGSSGRSKPTVVVCKSPETQQWFESTLMIIILGSGGGLLLVLIITLVACCCLSSRRRRKQLRDAEEFRLTNLDHMYPSSSAPQRQKLTARGQPAPPIPQEENHVSQSAPAPAPLPTSSHTRATAQSRTRPKTRARPPPPPEDVDEEAPPLPRPRRMAP